MILPVVRRLSRVVSLICAAVAISGVQAFGASLTTFTGLGSGLSANALSSCPVGLCPGSDSCVCVPISGTGKAGSIGAVKFATTVVLDGSQPIGNCDEGLGTVTLTSNNKPSNVLVLNYVGSICATPSAFVLNAAYVIDAGASKGKFAGATGSGNIAGSEDSTSGAILGNINGTLLP